MTIRRISGRVASAARAAADAGFVMDSGQLKMTTVLNMNSNKIINLADGVADADAAAKSQAGGGGDARTILTRTFKLRAADITGKGAVTTATHTLLTLGANEAIRWAWMENAGAAASGVSLYLSIGRSGDLDSLYIQRDMTASGAIEADNDNHGTDLGAYKALGESNTGSPKRDAEIYYGDEEVIKVESTTTGGNHDDLSAGGDWYIHLEIVRVDTAQLEAVS